MKQILSIVAHNRPGVLAKITGLISRRGYNIDSLTSGVTQNPEYARLTITVDADEPTMKQIQKQVAKISEVERIKVLHKETSALRSMLLIKVHVGEKQMEVLQLAQAFRSHAIDITGDSMTFVNTGSEDKLIAFANALRRYGIMEMVQTGVVALERGEASLAVKQPRYDWPGEETYDEEPEAKEEKA